MSRTTQRLAALLLTTWSLQAGAQPLPVADRIAGPTADPIAGPIEGATMAPGATTGIAPDAIDDPKLSDRSSDDPAAAIASPTPIAPRSDADAAYDRDRARALEAARAGRFADAAAALAPLCARYPEDFPVHLDRAYYHLRAGDHAAAEAAYRAALAISPDSKDARLGLVDALLGLGRFADALGPAAALVKQYPETAIRNRHALALYRLDRFEESEAEYRRSLDGAPDDVDARLGLAFCLARRDEPGQARALFTDAARSRPGDLVAREGLALVGRPHRVTAWTAGSMQYLPNHPSRPSFWGLALGLDATLMDRIQLGAVYRHLGDIGGDTQRSAFTQDEGWFTLGYQRRAFGVALHAAFAQVSTSENASSAIGQNAVVFGLSARARAWAEFEGALAFSSYSNFNILQATLGVALPLHRMASLYLGGQVQAGPARIWPEAKLELRLRGERWSAAASAEYGPQHRLVDFAGASIYNIGDERQWALGARLSLPLFGPVSAFASYGYERFRTYDRLMPGPGPGPGPGQPPPIDPNRYTDTDSHRALLGVSVSF